MTAVNLFIHQYQESGFSLTLKALNHILHFSRYLPALQYLLAADTDLSAIDNRSCSNAWHRLKCFRRKE